MPLYAAICRSLERKSLIFLGLGFFFASRQALLGRDAHRERCSLANPSRPASYFSGGYAVVQIPRRTEGPYRAVCRARIGLESPIRHLGGRSLLQSRLAQSGIPARVDRRTRDTEVVLHEFER